MLAHDLYVAATSTQRPQLTVSDPRSQRLLLRRLQRAGAPLLSVSLPQGTTRHWRVISVDSEQQCIIVDAHDHPSIPAAGLGVCCRYAGRASLYAFDSTLTVDGAGRGVLIWPQAIRQYGFRDSFRKPAAGTSLMVSMQSPTGSLNATVRDLGARGLCVRHHQAAVQGERQPDLIAIVIHDHAHTVPCTARVCWSDVDADGSCQVGLEIQQYAGPAAAADWRRLVLAHLFPGLRCGDETLVDAWRLLVASGYIADWVTPGQVGGLDARYLAAWRELPQHCGESLAVYRDGEALATVAGNMSYPRTILVHHLAADTLARRKRYFVTAMRELYGAIMLMIQHRTAARYFLVYYEQSKNWNDEMNGHFVARYSAPEDFVYTTNRVYRCDARTKSGDDVEDLLSSSLSVRPVAAAEASEIAAWLAERLSPMEIDAFAYHAEEFLLQAFEDSSRVHGCERTRRAFVAREGARPLALLIAETGNEAINVFGLENAFRIIDLASDAAARGAHAVLLATARRHYIALGKAACLFFDDSDVDVQILATQGFAFVSRGLRWIVSRAAVPAWQSHVDDLLSVTEGRDET